MISFLNIKNQTNNFYRRSVKQKIKEKKKFSNQRLILNSNKRDYCNNKSLITIIKQSSYK